MSSHLLTATNATSCRTTFNHKHADTPLVRVAEQNGRRYDVAELVGALDDLPRVPVASHLHLSPPHERSSEAAAPLRLSSAARRVWEGEDVKLTEDGRIDRSASLVRIAMIGLEAGLTRAQLVVALAERDEALDWGKYTRRVDALRQYEAIVNLVGHGERTKPRH